MHTAKKRTAKGDFGFHKSQRRKKLAITALFYAAAFSMYFAAAAILGTNQNWFTILAVLILLPAAKQTVALIMLLRAGDCPQEVREAVENHVGTLDNAYELYFTTEKKNFNILHLTAAGKTVAALTQDPKCDCPAGEQHLRKMLMTNGFHGYQVKIFSGLDSYLTRLDQLRNLGSEEGADHAALFELLYRISL